MREVRKMAAERIHTRVNPIAEWHVHGASTRNEDGLSYLLVSEYLLPSLWDGPKQSRSQRPQSNKIQTWWSKAGLFLTIIFW